METKTQTTFPRMHVSLYVNDLDKTIAFYDKFFGQEPSKIKDRYAKYELDAPALIISFIEGKNVKPEFGHLGFQVETKEELNDRLNIARGYNLVEKEEIGTACCYAIQDKFWTADPDGYQWEVYYFHEDAEFNDPRVQEEAGVACCSGLETKEKAEGACC